MTQHRIAHHPVNACPFSLVLPRFLSVSFVVIFFFYTVMSVVPLKNASFCFGYAIADRISLGRNLSFVLPGKIQPGGREITTMKARFIRNQSIQGSGHFSPENATFSVFTGTRLKILHFPLRIKICLIDGHMGRIKNNLKPLL